MEIFAVISIGQKIKKKEDLHDLDLTYIEAIEFVKDFLLIFNLERINSQIDEFAVLSLLNNIFGIKIFFPVSLKSIPRKKQCASKMGQVPNDFEGTALFPQQPDQKLFLSQIPRNHNFQAANPKQAILSFEQRKSFLNVPKQFLPSDSQKAQIDLFQHL